MSEWATRSANRNLPRHSLISKKGVRWQRKEKKRKERKKESLFLFLLHFGFKYKTKIKKLKTKTERERERKRKERKSHFSPFFGDPKLANSRVRVFFLGFWISSIRLDLLFWVLIESLVCGFFVLGIWIRCESELGDRFSRFNFWEDSNRLGFLFYFLKFCMHVIMCGWLNIEVRGLVNFGD